MPYIFSTLSSDNEYRVYKKGGADMQLVEHRIVINGKANIANKHIITPQGIVTEVTEEDLKILEENEVFKIHKKGGFIKVSTKKAEADAVAKDMTKKDKSAPKTPEDFKGDKAPKVNKE